MSGVEVAAVAVPVAVAVSSGALAILKGPGPMLKNAQKNIEDSKFLISKHSRHIPGDVRESLKEKCHRLEIEVNAKRAAGDHRVKHAYKPKVWTSTRELEHKAEKLYASTRASSAQSALEESDERLRKEAARKASKDAKEASKAAKATKARTSDTVAIPPLPTLPTKKSINGLSKKVSQSSVNVRSGQSGASRTEAIPPLPSGNELRGEFSKQAMRGLPSKSEASGRDGQHMKNPVRRGHVA